MERKEGEERKGEEEKGKNRRRERKKQRVRLKRKNICRMEQRKERNMMTGGYEMMDEMNRLQKVKKDTRRQNEMRWMNSGGKSNPMYYHPLN